MLLASCNNDFLTDLEDNYFSTPAQTSTWEEQLEYAKNNTKPKTRMSSDEIYLVGYTHKGKISTSSEIPIIIEQLFADNAVTVLYTDYYSFEIVDLQSIRQRAIAMNIDDPLDNLRSQLESSIQVGMEILELKWSFNNDIFYSTAIASNSNGGIIYDHIGFMILEEDSSKPMSEKIDLNIPTLKNGFESDSEIVRSFSKSDSGKNIYGFTVWEYSISCRSYFKENGILCNRALNSSRDSVIGWSCEAEIKTINGQIDSSSYHEFAWAYAYGAAVSVSITWNGTGFTVSGGGHGDTGTEVHRK